MSALLDICNGVGGGRGGTAGVPALARPALVTGLGCLRRHVQAATARKMHCHGSMCPLPWHVQERAKDDWRDANPRGWGNSKLRPCG